MPSGSLGATNVSLVTQFSTESLFVPTLKSFVTQIATESTFSPSAQSSKITQFILETIDSGRSASRLTQTIIETVYSTHAAPTVPVGARSTGTYRSLIAATPGLVSYWPLDETSGTTAADSFGTNTGTYHGGYTLNSTAYLPPTFGSAVTFNGSTGYVSTVNILNYTTYSLELWFYINSYGFGDGQIAGFQFGGNRSGNLLMGSLGNIKFNISSTLGTATFTSPLTYSLGQWRHLVVTVTNTVSIIIYVDGVNIGSMLVGTVFSGFTNPNFTIGGDPVSGLWFNGIVDEVALYNVALDQATINSHLTTAALGTSPYSTVTQLSAETVVLPPSSTTYTTQIATEAVYQPSSLLSNITQLVLETVDSGKAVSNITQMVLETLSTAASTVRITQVVNEIVYSTPTAPTVPVGSRSAGNYPAVILAEAGLQSYWKLNETTGTTAVDSKGTNTGTYNGGYTLGVASALPLTLGTAVSFNGSTGYVSTTNTLNYTNYSIELWFNITAYPASNGQLVGFSNGGSYTGNLFLDSTGHLNFYYFNGGAHLLTTLSVYPTGVWHHVVVTVSNNGAVIVYVDGIPVVSGINGATWASYTGPSFNIGNGPTSAYGFFNGLIDEVALYNVVLSQSTINSHLTPAVLGTNPYSTTTQVAVETITFTAITSFTASPGIGAILLAGM